MDNRELQIEHRLTNVEAQLKAIMTNHLPHIEAKVDRVQWLLVTALIALIINLVKGFVK